MSKNSVVRRLASFVLCFGLIATSVATPVFAKDNGPVAPKDKEALTLKDKAPAAPIVKAPEPPKVKAPEPPKVKAPEPPKGKGSLIIGLPGKDNKVSKPSDPMQSFILDSLDSKQNKEIAKMLSKMNWYNIDKYTKDISKILKGQWESKKGQELLSDVLSTYLEYTPKAQLCMSTLIGEGLKGVKIPNELSSQIRKKINKDFTGNKDDDRGIKFMAKALVIFNDIAMTNNEKLVTIKYGKYNRPEIKFNRLEGYSYITNSLDQVLSSLNALPSDEDTFESFIGYYEDYINDLGVNGLFSFVRLLAENAIPFSAEK